ncbi:MAG TPA: tol-pal system-associated acyl-CoA thioesterase [Fontimonas sp.]
MSGAVFEWPIRVYYEDTDASGVAYHANYLRWFERARTEWLRTLELGQERLRDELGVVFTVAGLDIVYRRPARLDDRLQVQTRVASIKRASLVFEQRLLRSADGELLATVSVRIGCVGYADFRPVALPAPMQHALERRQGAGAV